MVVPRASPSKKVEWVLEGMPKVALRYDSTSSASRRFENYAADLRGT